MNSVNAYTVEAWIKLDCLNKDQLIYSERQSGNPIKVNFRVSAANVLRGTVRDDAGTLLHVDATTPLGTAAFYYVVFVRNGNNIYLYLNGTQDGSGSASFGTVSNATLVRLGMQAYWASYFDGIIDEVQISNIARSADWITTTYNNQSNQSNPSGFYSIGSEELPPLPSPPPPFPASSTWALVAARLLGVSILLKRSLRKLS